jgi:hypothetical protein
MWRIKGIASADLGRRKGKKKQPRGTQIDIEQAL